MADAHAEFEELIAAVRDGQAQEVQVDAERRQQLEERIFSFPALAEQEADDVEPLLGPVLRRGWRCVIGGHTGEGKSTFALAMVRAVVSQEQLLGWHGAGGRALVIDLEQDIGIAKRRVGETWFRTRYVHGESDLAELMSTTTELMGCTYCSWAEGMDLAKPGPDRDVLSELIERTKPDVVMIDPLYKTFLGNPADDELAGRVIRFLDQLRVDHGFGLILPMHMRKPPKGGGGGFTKHDLYSGGQWIWGAEVILGLKRRAQRGAALHFWKDRAGEIPTDEVWDMTLDARHGFVRSTFAAPLTPLEQVWKALQNEPAVWFYKDQLREMVGLSHNAARTACEELRHKYDHDQLPGLQVRKSSHGRYEYCYGGRIDELDLPVKGMADSQALIDKIEEDFDATEQ